MYVGLYTTQDYYSYDEKLTAKLSFTLTRVKKIILSRLTVRHNNYNKEILTTKWTNNFRKKKPVVVHTAILRSWRAVMDSFLRLLGYFPY